MVSLGTIVTKAIDAIMHREELLKTAEGMIDNLSSLIVKPDRLDGDMIYSEANMTINKFTRYLEILGIDSSVLPLIFCRVRAWTCVRGCL